VLLLLLILHHHCIHSQRELKVESVPLLLVVKDAVLLGRGKVWGLLMVNSLALGTQEQAQQTHGPRGLRNGRLYLVGKGEGKRKLQGEAEKGVSCWQEKRWVGHGALCRPSPQVRGREGGKGGEEGDHGRGNVSLQPLPTALLPHPSLLPTLQGAQGRVAWQHWRRLADPLRSLQGKDCSGIGVCAIAMLPRVIKTTGVENAGKVLFRLERLFIASEEGIKGHTAGLLAQAPHKRGGAEGAHAQKPCPLPGALHKLCPLQGGRFHGSPALDGLAGEEGLLGVPPGALISEEEEVPLLNGFGGPPGGKAERAAVEKRCIGVGPTAGGVMKGLLKARITMLPQEGRWRQDSG
jgi:hypothetical protein